MRKEEMGKKSQQDSCRYGQKNGKQKREEAKTARTNINKGAGHVD